jgi:hypothetical protein
MKGRQFRRRVVPPLLDLKATLPDRTTADRASRPPRLTLRAVPAGRKGATRREPRRAPDSADVPRREEGKGGSTTGLASRYPHITPTETAMGKPRAGARRFPHLLDRKAKEGAGHRAAPSQRGSSHRLQTSQTAGSFPLLRRFPGSRDLHAGRAAPYHSRREPRRAPVSADAFGLTPPALAVRYQQQIARNPMVEPFFMAPEQWTPRADLSPPITALAADSPGRSWDAR